MGKFKFSSKEVIFLVILTCLISVSTGYFLRVANEPEAVINEVEYNSDIASFVENFNNIKNNYYKEVNDSELIDAAISGMVDSLEDIHSVSVSEDSSNVFNATLNGYYSGVGIEIYNDTDMNIVVVSVFEGSPAEVAGIKPGDIIIKVDDIDFEGLDTSKLPEYISGSENINFNVVVLRDEKEIEFTVTKEVVVLDSVFSEIIEKNDKKIGYIYISIFAGNTPSQFRGALDNVKDTDSIIIDVRNNSGGHLLAVNEMLSLMLDSTHVIYQEDTKGIIVKFYSEGNVDYDKDIIIIQNELSASASEILASCLSEQLDAKIIGMSSYGKGTVQELITVDDSLQYKFTTKKWLTSEGLWIDSVGVTPDFELQLDDNYTSEPSTENDNQLNKAIELLTE